MKKLDTIDIWELNKSKISSFIRKKGINYRDFEDLLHEVFIKFWTNHQNIKDKGKILNWLYSITRFTIADYFRKKENLKENFFSFNEIYSFVDLPANRSNESRKVLPVIFSLPSKYKNALLLSDIYGFSHNEIAAQFDLSVSCVKTRVMRARKLLAERMHDCCSFSFDKYGNIVNCTEKKAYFECLEKVK